MTQALIDPGAGVHHKSNGTLFDCFQNGNSGRILGTIIRNNLTKSVI